MDLINLEYALSGWNVPLATAGESKPEETQVHLSILNPSITKEMHTKIKGWKCKKQTAISHSSAEAEVISLDAGLRMEGIPALVLWDQLLEVLAPKACSKIKTQLPDKVGGWKLPRAALEILEDIDHVPPTYPMTSGAMKLV